MTLVDKIWKVAEDHNLDDKLMKEINYRGGMDDLINYLDDESDETEIFAEIIDYID